jgi:hypothetical protein
MAILKNYQILGYFDITSLSAFVKFDSSLLKDNKKINQNQNTHFILPQLICKKRNQGVGEISPLIGAEPHSQFSLHETGNAEYKQHINISIAIYYCLSSQKN